ncbi:hypothetical protein C0J52_18997 [Blattella germanica]|nr:hypothetical protein C0J52_18997 [Blattella germanica]
MKENPLRLKKTMKMQIPMKLQNMKGYGKVIIFFNLFFQHLYPVPDIEMIDPVTRFFRYVGTEASEGTPKRDRWDYMDLRVDVTHSLLNSTVTEDYSRVVIMIKQFLRDYLRRGKHLLPSLMIF